MRLYHGTNVEIEEIDLALCQPKKDFGTGFYLTPIMKHARGMARRKAALNEPSSPIVLSYNFNGHLLHDKRYKVKIFNKPDKEWAKFVLKHRNRDVKHNYDIVVGPIANDDMAALFRSFEEGEIDMDKLVEEMTYREFSLQYVFCTKKSVILLKKHAKK